MPAPFVTTDTATDLALAFALLPLWWALGLDQLIWVPLGLVILCKRWLIEKKLRVERTALILVLAFAASYLLSGFSNAGVLYAGGKGHGNLPYVYGLISSYSSNALNYAAAAIFLLLAADCARREGERLRVLQGLGFMALGSSIVGALPYLGAPLQFEAPVQFLLSDWAKEHFLTLERSIKRSLYATTCLFGKELPRAKSVFFYSTLYATALAMIVPPQAYLAWLSRGRARVLWIPAAVLSLVGMLLTTSRAPFASLFVAAAAVALPWAAHVYVTQRGRRIPLLRGATVILGVGLLAGAAGPGGARAGVAAADFEACQRLSAASEARSTAEPVPNGADTISVVAQCPRQLLRSQVGRLCQLAGPLDQTSHARVGDPAIHLRGALLPRLP